MPVEFEIFEWKISGASVSSFGTTTARHPEQSYFLMTHSGARHWWWSKWHEIFHTKQFSPTFLLTQQRQRQQTAEREFRPQPSPSGEWNFLIFITAAPLTSTTTTFLVYGDVQAGRSRGLKDDSWEFCRCDQSLKIFQHFIVSGTLKMWKLSLNRFQLWLWPTRCRRHCHRSPAWTSSNWTEKRALKVQEFAMTSRISLRFLGKLNLRWDAHYLCIAILSFDYKQRFYKKSFDSRERLPSCQNNSLLLLWWACGKSKYFPLISRKKTRFHSGILIVNERRRRQEFFYFYLHRSFIMKWRGEIRRRILLLCLLLRSSWDRIWKFHKLLHCTVCSNKWFTRAFSSSQSARPSSIVPARSAE